MNKKVKPYHVLIFTMLFLLCLSTPIFAANPVAFDRLPADAIYVPSEVDGKLGTGGLFVDYQGYATIHMDFSSQNILAKDTRPYIERTLHALKRAENSPQESLTTNEMWDLNSAIIEAFPDNATVVRYLLTGSSADFVGARRVMSGVEPIVAIIVAIITYGSLIGFGIVLALDLAFITFPPLQGSATGDSTGKRKKPIWVSVEAFNAVKRSLESVSSYGNREGSSKVAAVVDYLKNRIVFVVFFVICILLLVSGELMSFTITAVSSLLEGLFGLIGIG